MTQDLAQSPAMLTSMNRRGSVALTHSFASENTESSSRNALQVHTNNTWLLKSLKLVLKINLQYRNRKAKETQNPDIVIKNKVIVFSLVQVSLLN